MPKPRSFFYRNPLVYRTLLRLIHGKTFDERYRYMAGQIGSHSSVLEPGAGPGVIVPFLDPTTSYYGFDLNADFVADAKRRGINIVYGNILDGSMYRTCAAAVLVDVLHHLRPENQSILLHNTLRATKQMIIICEPYGHGNPILSKIPGISRLQKAFFNYFERDGNNEADSEHIHSKSGLRQKMENGFGVIPKNTKKEIREFGHDLIVTYYLKK